MNSLIEFQCGFHQTLVGALLVISRKDISLIAQILHCFSRTSVAHQFAKGFLKPSVACFLILSFPKRNLSTICFKL